MSATSIDPPSTVPGGARGRGAAICALAAAVFFLCLAGPAAAGEPSPPSPPPATTPQPPAVGDPAPNLPIIDQKNNETSLHEVVKKNPVVLVFYIGYG